MAAGTSRRCGGCAATLRVPKAPLRTPVAVLRFAAGGLVGVTTVVILALVFRTAPADAPAAAAPKRVATTIPGATPDSALDLGIIDDPIASRMQSIREEFSNPRFAFSDQTRPYFIALESSDRSVDAERMAEFAKELGVAHDAFRREVADRAGFPAVKDALLTVVILRSRESFDRYYERREKRRQPEAVKGVYEYRSRMIVTYQDGVIPREQLLHEAAHQLLHYHLLRQTENRKVAQSFWLQEGLATYFEGLHRRPDGEIGPGRASDHRRFPLIKHIAARKDSPEFIPLSQLLVLTVDGYWDWAERAGAEDPAAADRRAQIHYAESWALVAFLRQSSSRHRKVLDLCLRREVAGTGSKEAFEEILRTELGIGLPELEAQFLRYLQTLQ